MGSVSQWESKMRLAWMRSSNTLVPRLSASELRREVSHSDELGLRQYHLSGRGLDVLEALPPMHRLRIGVDLPAPGSESLHSLRRTVRSARDGLEGRLVLGLDTDRLAGFGTGDNAMEFALSETTQPCASGRREMAASLPEVLVLPKPGRVPDVARAAAHGFHVYSPAWQSRRDVSRHWPAIVAGATHALKRVRPCQWHIARFVFVSDDRALVDDYLNGPALRYLNWAVSRTMREQNAGDFLIAGSSEEVAERLVRLRRLVGPFGTLHCVDLGLDHAEACRQRERLVKEVLPLMASVTASGREFDLV